MPRVVSEEYRQRRTYSVEVKKLVIYQRHNLKKTVGAIAIDLDMPKRVVERVLKTWNETGEVTSNSSGKGRKRKTIMTEEEKEFLLSLAERTPNLYLDEFQQQLLLQHGLIVGLSTIWNTLTELGLTRKKLSKIAAERNQEARAKYRYDIGAETAERLVFVDESRIDLRTTFRLNGWAPKGARAVVSTPFQCGQEWSILPALAKDGIFFMDLRKGAYDGEAFIQFIQDLLKHMNPWPEPRSVLVMDNCRIHHVEEVEQLCTEKGVALYYLPAYSPDLNPIEEAFSFVKAHMRRNDTMFHTTMQGRNDFAVKKIFTDAMTQITPELACSWITHSGYM